jgi:hypothetical protein
MKLTKSDLQNIFSAAKQSFLDDDKGDLDNQQFMAQCYTKAITAFLKVDVELPKRIFVEPVEE